MDARGTNPQPSFYEAVYRWKVDVVTRMKAVLG
jgi:hypothetical protein